MPSSVRFLHQWMMVRTHPSPCVFAKLFPLIVKSTLSLEGHPEWDGRPWTMNTYSQTRLHLWAIYHSQSSYHHAFGMWEESGEPTGKVGM